MRGFLITPAVTIAVVGASVLQSGAELGALLFQLGASDTAARRFRRPGVSC